MSNRCSLRRRASHILAHQIMALCIQAGGIPVSDWWAWIACATPFQELTDDDRRQLIEHMLERDILAQVGGRLLLGERGERMYGRRHFLELYAVFETPSVLRVLWGNQEIGTIDTLFVEQRERDPVTFTLAGRAWRAVHIDMRRGVMRVEPSNQGGLARWRGRPRVLHRELCQAMRSVLVDTEAQGVESQWSRRAHGAIRELRSRYEFLSPDGQLDLLPDGDGYRLWTFAGGLANQLLASVLSRELGATVRADNLSLTLREQAGQSAVTVRDTIDKLRASQRPDDADALYLASLGSSQRLSKFQPCLPADMRNTYLATVLSRPRDACRALAHRLAIHA